MKGQIEDYILVAAFFFVLVSIPLSIHGLTGEVCKFRLAVESMEVVENPKAQYVTLTAYAPYPHSNKLTAIGKKPVVGRTCAISDDLIMKGWLGKGLYIRGFGVLTATDVLGGYNTRWIDIYVADKKTAEKFGVRKEMMACVLD